MGLDGRERACGSVLEGGEGRVLLQALRKVLGSLRVELVAAEAVNGSQTEASAVLTLLQRQAQLGCWHSYIGRTASRAKGRAYLMLVNVSLTLSADPNDSAPSGKARRF